MPNDHVALTGITSPEAGQGATATVTLTGDGFTGTPTVRLARPGQPEIVASDVTPDSAAQALTATFDFSSAAEGAYDVVVELPAFSVSSTLVGAFTVGPPQPANVTTLN